MVTAKVQLELKKYTQATSGRTRYNIELLSDRTTQTFQPALFNRCQVLHELIEEKDSYIIDTQWQCVKQVCTKTCEETLRKKKLNTNH